MTDLESIQILTANRDCLLQEDCDRDCENCSLFYEKGDVEQYSDALDNAIESLEKRVPKKSEYTGYTKHDYCYTCNNKILYRNWNYCPKCGQRILREELTL